MDGSQWLVGLCDFFVKQYLNEIVDKTKKKKIICIYYTLGEANEVSNSFVKIAIFVPKLCVNFVVFIPKFLPSSLFVPNFLKRLQFSSLNLRIEERKLQPP